MVEAQMESHGQPQDRSKELVYVGFGEWLTNEQIDYIWATSSPNTMGREKEVARMEKEDKEYERDHVHAKKRRLDPLPVD